MTEPTFIKVGDRLINPQYIVDVNLAYFHAGETFNGVLITLMGHAIIFQDEEAEILRRYFLHGNRAVHLYWVEKP